MTSGEGKLVALLLPAITAADVRYGAAIAFGIVSGWFCRAAIPYMNRRPWTEIRREFFVSLMISGGSLVATLYFARLMEADELAAAGIGWAVSFGGLKALSLIHEYVLLPIRNAVGKSPEQLMSERNQEAQKMKAAAMQAFREIERDDNDPD